jgi:ferredoxin
MALMINEECINCGACEPECPNTAIYAGGEEYELNGQSFPALSQDYYYVVAEKCTECAGFHDSEQCVAVCPTDACVKDPNHVESRDQLLEKARILHPDQNL